MKIKEYKIHLHRFTSEQDPTKPAWAADDLDTLPQLCALIGTAARLFSTEQLTSIGAEFAGALASVAVSVHSDDEMIDPYECANCGHIEEYKTLPMARDITQRMEPGDTYTDVECPKCGSLCHAHEEPEPPPSGKLTLGGFRHMTGSMPDETVMTYHGYDKGCCLLAYRVENLWFYPKAEGVSPTHVVINPGRNYDHRTPGEPAAPVVVIPPTAVFNETEMIELLEFARIALADANTFDNIAETSDLADEYLIALRDKLNAVMDSDVPLFDQPTIVPGMRVRWNDPDAGACSHEGIVSKCTTPIEDGIIVLHMEDGWSNECLRKEIEILPPQEPKVLLGDISTERVVDLSWTVARYLGADQRPVFLIDLHDARSHGLNKEDIMRAWESACDAAKRGDLHFVKTTRGNQVVPTIPM